MQLQIDKGFPTIPVRQDSHLMVNCRERFERQIGIFYTWSDVAAICYVSIKEVVQSEDGFIGEYFETGTSIETCNPNLAMLERLANTIRVIALRQMRHFDSDALALEQFLNSVSCINLTAFGNESHNKLSPYWAIIRGIDQAYGDYEGFQTIMRRGPLNSVEKRNVGVYLSSPPSIMSLALDYSGLERIPEFSFNNQLQYIHFYPKVAGRCLPKIRVIMPTQEGDGPGLHTSTPKDQLLCREADGPVEATHAISQFHPGLSDEWRDLSAHIKIGLVQFSPNVITGIKSEKLDGDGSPLTSIWPITFSALRGRRLTAVYAENYEETYESTVIDALDICMKHSCQIIVFPEIVVSPCLRDVICAKLEEPNDNHRPLLVVAGSSWEPGEEFGNNVSFLYDGFGHEVGRYYKFSPYGRFADTHHIDFVEGLDHPGKECTIIDIAGIGRVLPSICKDLVSDSRYTLDLAKYFYPNIVCTPALSSSMDTGFAAPVDMLSERALTVSVICNQCGQMRSRSEGIATVGMVGAPLKHAQNSRRTKVLCMRCIRNSECHDKCLKQLEKNGKAFCINVIDIDCSRFADDGYVANRKVALPLSELMVN